MESPNNFETLMMIDIIFNEIMMNIGIECLESLNRCRQVCKGWDQRISRNILKNNNKKTVIKAMNWGQGILPSDEEISHVKCLGRAHA